MVEVVEDPPAVLDLDGARRFEVAHCANHHVAECGGSAVPKMVTKSGSSTISTPPGRERGSHP